MQICRLVGACAALVAGDLALGLSAQEQVRHVPETALQPLAQQVRRLESALRYLGEPLPAADRQAIDEAIGSSDETTAVSRLQQALDRHVLLNVHINPESRVRVDQGSAPPELVQGGTRVFLVKVVNEAGVTAPLVVQSPNSGRVYVPSRNRPEAPKDLTDVHVRERWAG